MHGVFTYLVALFGEILEGSMGRPYYDSSGPWYKATIDFSTLPIGAVEISQGPAGTRPDFKEVQPCSQAANSINDVGHQPSHGP